MKRFLTVAAALVSASVVYAQDRTTTTQPAVGTTTGTAGATAYQRGSAFVGSGVMLNNKQFGKITDYAIGPNGRIEYAIVDNNGQYVAVPYGAMRYNAQARGYAISNPNLTEDRLRGLYFQQNNWPNFTNQQWQQQQRGIWGADAYRNDNVRPGTPGSGPGPVPGTTQPGGTTSPSRVTPQPTTPPDRR